ncbi:hypothetical protein QUF70_06360 [Desulfobacterales bacterium HSG17]|nr:hypothetical protein [Desulfobacterales bacterium HSG17]
MKKQNAYTITDDIFLDTLEIISLHLNDIPYAIVGGGAVQVYVGSIAVKHSGLNSIKEINGLSFIFRKTGDIDMSFCYDSAKLVKKFNLIISQSDSPYTFHSFTKRFVIQDKIRRFNLNYQTEPVDLKGISEYYDDIIATAIVVKLPFKKSMLNLKIAKPEYIIASKLTRIKPKDQVDISMILKAMEIDDYPFDSEEVRAILKSVNKADKYDILAELMDAY